MYNYAYIAWNETNDVEYLITKYLCYRNVQLRVYYMKLYEVCWILENEIFMLS